jgi:hypothetical protein
MSEMGSGSGPPPGIRWVDAIANALEPTELVRRRREFIAANPNDPVVKAYLAEKAKNEEKSGG